MCHTAVTHHVILLILSTSTLGIHFNRSNIPTYHIYCTYVLMQTKLVSDFQSFTKGNDALATTTTDLTDSTVDTLNAQAMVSSCWCLVSITEQNVTGIEALVNSCYSNVLLLTSRHDASYGPLWETHAVIHKTGSTYHITIKGRPRHGGHR